MDLVLVPVHLGMHWCLAVRVHLVIEHFPLFLVIKSSAPPLQHPLSWASQPCFGAKRRVIVCLKIMTIMLSQRLSSS